MLSSGSAWPAAPRFIWAGTARPDDRRPCIAIVGANYIVRSLLKTLFRILPRPEYADVCRTKLSDRREQIGLTLHFINYFA